MRNERRAVLITGATSGIGLATAAAFAKEGARVLVHGRSEQSAQAAVTSILASTPSADLRAVWGDLSELAQVRALAAQVMEEARLDVLVHNAGLERWERALSRDGIELTLAVNHVAPFLLTHLLVPLLERSRPSRIIFVSSIVHGWGRMHWDDMDARTWYAPEPVYYQSKLAAALGAQAFARRLQGRGITVLLAPPGLTKTSFARDFRGFAKWWSQTLGARLFRPATEVAKELVHIAFDARFQPLSGAYIDRLRVGLPDARARDLTDQERLWMRTCEELGLDAHHLPPGPPLPPIALPQPTFFSWMRAVMLGETLGFTATTLIAFGGLTLWGHPSTVQGRVIALVIMVLAGTIEGASLGAFQWSQLRHWLLDLPARAFIASTIAVAAGGWMVGMSVPLIATWLGAQASPAEAAASHADAGPSALAIALFSMLFGAIAGALFGAAQASMLRKHVEGVGRWLLGSSAGWALGLPLSYLAGSLGTADMSVWQALGLSASAGAGMGLAVALGTFVAMRGMRAKTR